MRLFIAIPLPTDVRRAAAAAQARLIEFGAEGRYVPRENFHITLHFIGESDRLTDAVEAMQASVRDIRPFVLRLVDYGGFGGKNGKTGFLTVKSDSTELKLLYETLECELWERGFSKNRSTLTPHITLGRNITGDGGFSLEKQTAAFTVTEIVLYESVSMGGRMRYTQLHRERIQ